PPRGRGLVLLPPFLHGPPARGRFAQARARALRRLRARARHLPVVPFRGPPPGRCRALAAPPRRTPSAHRDQLGRLPPAERARLVRSADARPRGVRGHAHLLLHPRAPGRGAALHQPPAGAGGVRRVLRRDDAPLRRGPGGGTARGENPGRVSEKRMQLDAAIGAMPAAHRWLRRLEAGTDGLGDALLVIVAHADDEVIGLGGQLARLSGVRLIHVTDGAPHNLFDARAAGFDCWQDYALARRDELHAALALAGIAPTQTEQLGVPDQEASLMLVELAAVLAARFAALCPEVIVTHAYEGGHPDHDATAFAVHAACTLVQRERGRAPALVEITGYHMAAGEPVMAAFQHDPDVPVTTLPLGSDQRAFKRRLVECFATQRRALANFPIDVERFRPAPAYDFTRAPHADRLF